MSNIIQFPKKQKTVTPKSSSKMKVEYSYGVDNVVTPEFTVNFEQDIGDQYITDWHEFMQFFVPGTLQSARMDTFSDDCYQLEVLGHDLLATDSEKFRQLSSQLTQLIKQYLP